jgi:hypothetical protein
MMDLTGWDAPTVNLAVLRGLCGPVLAEPDRELRDVAAALLDDIDDMRAQLLRLACAIDLLHDHPVPDNGCVVCLIQRFVPASLMAEARRENAAVTR